MREAYQANNNSYGRERQAVFLPSLAPNSNRESAENRADDEGEQILLQDGNREANQNSSWRSRAYPFWAHPRQRHPSL